MAFTGLDDRVVRRADDIVRVHFRRGPFCPLPARALRDAIAQGARPRDLHLGNKLRAPERLIQRVHETIAISVMCIEAFGRCLPGV